MVDRGFVVFLYNVLHRFVWVVVFRVMLRLELCCCG